MRRLFLGTIWANASIFDLENVLRGFFLSAGWMQYCLFWLSNLAKDMLCIKATLHFLHVEF